MEPRTVRFDAWPDFIVTFTPEEGVNVDDFVRPHYWTVYYHPHMSQDRPRRLKNICRSHDALIREYEQHLRYNTLEEWTGSASIEPTFTP